MVEMPEQLVEAFDILKREPGAGDRRDVLIEVGRIAGAGEHDVAARFVSGKPVSRLNDRLRATLVDQEGKWVFGVEIVDRDAMFIDQAIKDVA
jgi:hypothetical protein